MEMNTGTIKEKRFWVMKVDRKNKNHRIYQRPLVQRWLDSEKLKDEGFDIEFVIGESDIDYEFLKEELSCGIVTKLELEGDDLYATARFKVEGPKAEIIYSDEKFFESVALVPKGKGAVKNQIVQDDYELYGFNLIKAEASSFKIEEPATSDKNS